MEYEIGDTIRIRTSQERPAEILFGWNPKMDQYVNKIYEIKNKESTYKGYRYSLKCDPSDYHVNDWSWSAEMFAPAYMAPSEEEVFVLFK